LRVPLSRVVQRIRKHVLYHSTSSQHSRCHNHLGLQLNFVSLCSWPGGYMVAQLAEALCYRLGSCGFGSPWGNWKCSLTSSLQLHSGPRVHSVTNRNEYQRVILWGKDDRCVGLTPLPPSCTNCLEIYAHQPPGTLRACSRL
jgi:hypothetical protein